jgi:hypothetical protein
MKVRLYPAVQNSVEVEACVFTTPESVDRFIRALEVAKRTVWLTLPKAEKKK